MARVSADYTPGHGTTAVDFMAARNVREHAAFMLDRLRPGLRLLDVGCGPGVMTAELAARVAPAETVGVDRSGGQFAVGRERARQTGLTNLRLLEADAERLPFDDGGFDVVFSHALLEHVAEPVTVLREFARVLAPGGLLAVASPDWGGFLISPPTPTASAALERYEALQREHGGNPRVGRQLSADTVAAGFTLLGVTARYECYADRGRIAGYLAEQLDADGSEGHAAALRDWAPRSALFAQAWVSVLAVRRD